MRTGPSDLEGYVLHTYGDDRHLRNAVASALTIRRYDTARPIALYTDEAQRSRLFDTGLNRLFESIEILPESHRSIVGFKHHLHRFHPFERNLFVDSDMIWCRDPDPLWRSLSGYEFTATGTESADFFFGGPKDWRIVTHYFSNKRRRTLRRFDVTYLPRVQAGMLYSRNPELCRTVCDEARLMLSRRRETHFRSRLDEGRSEETCEWSLALAMARLDVPVYAWRQGHHTPQLDYVSDFVEHDEDFRRVRCRYFNDPRLSRLREFPYPALRDFGIWLSGFVPGRGDHMWITPFTLHFGWLKYKRVFWDFADRMWERELESARGAREDATAFADSERR
jgi:hypothetical protein